MLKALLSVALLSLQLAACASSLDVADLHRHYLAASNAHDLATLEAMTADDIIWRLGPFTFQGKDEALLPHETDAVFNTVLEVNDITIEGDVVEAELVERNDMLAAVGVERWRHYVRWVFNDDGEVVRKEAWRSSPDDAEVTRRLQPFRQWIRENHPEAVPNFDDVRDVWGREPALLNKQMLDAWIAAGSPGSIPPQE